MTLNDSVYDELDLAIAEIGAAMVAAEADGDKARRNELHARLLTLINSRTTAHQQRLHTKAWQRMLDEELTFAGNWTRDIA
jgi:hypothetical protein